MQKYFNSVTNSRGDAILGARVAVTMENGLPATIYSDNGVTVQVNPMITDGNGFFAFYAAAGRYTLRISGVGIPPIIITDVLLEDELAEFPTRIELSASTGLSEVGYAPDDAAAQTMTAAEIIGREVDIRNWLTAAERLDAESGTPLIDTTAKLQLALSYAMSKKKKAVGIGTFRTSGKLWTNEDIDLGKVTLHVYGTPSFAFDMASDGTATPGGYLIEKTMTPPKIINKTKPSVGWAEQGGGYRTVNALSCTIHFPYWSGFAVGVLHTSFGGRGNVYNNFFYGWSDNNQVNRVQPGDATSWANECNHYGGRYSHLITEGTAVAGVCPFELLPFDVTNATATWPDQHVFYKPSIEGEVPAYHFTIGGAYNKVFHGRWEANTPRVLLIGHASAQVNQRNEFYGGFKSSQIVYTTTGVVYLPSAIAGDGMDLNGTGDVQNISNSGGDGVGFPHMQGFPANISSLGKTNAATTWTYRIHATGLQGKRTGEANPRILIDFNNGLIRLGDGSVAPADTLLPITAGVLGTATHWGPFTTATYDLGIGSNRWRNANLSGSVGQFGVSPPGARATVNAAATDLATVVSLCNQLRAALIANGTCI